MPRTYDYSLTADNMIQMALEDLGVIAPGITPTAAQSTLALRRLNVLIKRLQVNPRLQFKASRRRRVTLFLAEAQQTYAVGSTSVRATAQYGRTTIDAAEAIGQTVLSVTLTSDATTDPGTTFSMKAGDTIGIEQNDNAVFWSTITSRAVDDTVTIAAGLDVAAAVGRYVWWYTDVAPRFTDIESAVLRNSSNQDSEIAVYREARSYDVGVADKYADGTPTAILIEPLRTYTRVTLNSQPTVTTDLIVMTVLYPFEDYDSGTEEIVLPQECMALVEWELAFAVAPAFRAKWTKEMTDNRSMAWESAMSLEPETSDEYFQCGGN